jgi:hypothetical protein
MRKRFLKWLESKYPQNFILRKPLGGSLIISLFVFGFTVLYQPFHTHAARSLSYAATMAAYSFLSGLLLYVSLRILKTLKYFSEESEWTILRELSGIFIVLSILGISIYFLGYFIEASGDRLNIPTFLNSYISGCLIGIIPLAFFSAVNYRYLFTPVESHNLINSFTTGIQGLLEEEQIRIISQLKKEELSFYPREFIYAESDGNYVIFYLNKNGQIKKEMIRNSINNIEQQLSHIPYFVRIHRAFIVNLKKVLSKQGNTLGYLLKLEETETKIPVSRQNTRAFNDLFAVYQN